MIKLILILSKFDGTWWTAFAALAALLGALATIVYTFITFSLFKKTKESIESANKVAAFNTYIKIKESLCNEDVDKMVESCSSNKIIITEMPTLRDIYTNSYHKKEVRSKLIDAIEDLAKYERDGLITLEDVDFAYGYLILNVGNCEAIVKFLNEIRKSYENNDIYQGFETLYLKVRNMLKVEEQLKYRLDFKAKE
jgi:hypothetical protein